MFTDLAPHLGMMMPELAQSQYNPFTMGENDCFTTYLKWNGRTHDVTDGLNPNTTYRVVSADIHSWHTELLLQEVSTGKILSEVYNSTLFTPLPTFLGYSKEFPKIGERFDMIKIDCAKQEMTSWHTSPVIAIERVGDKIWNVITRNSVYCVQLFK